LPPPISPLSPYTTLFRSGFLVDENLVRALHRKPPRLGPPAKLAEDVADRDRAHLRARHARNLEQRHSARGLRLDLDFLVVELAGDRKSTRLNSSHQIISY